MEKTSGGSRGEKREEVYIQEGNVGGWIWENGIKQWEQRMEVYKAATKIRKSFTAFLTCLHADSPNVCRYI